MKKQFAPRHQCDKMFPFENPQKSIFCIAKYRKSLSNLHFSL